MPKTKKAVINAGFSGAPHTGKMLKAFFAKRRTYKSALARALGVSPETVYSYQRRPAMMTDTVWHLCHALKHNFFADVAAALPADFSSDAPVDDSKEEKVARLEEELRVARAERDLLRGILAGRGEALVSQAKPAGMRRRRRSLRRTGGLTQSR